MKQKILLILTLLYSVVTMVFAGPISEAEAQQKASEFISGRNAKTAPVQSKAIMSDDIMFTTAEVCDAFYVFNNETSGGYVIVSADDRMPAVLGYSYSGTYNSDEIPDNMRSWLNGYVEQYGYMLQHDVSAVSTTSVTGDKIYPLIATKWWQNYPYNILCPQIDGYSTVTGCVATAMAQIMYYHHWPNQTTAIIPTYTTSSNNIIIPSIGITSINYDNMLYEYGYEKKIFHTAQEDAVANLMRLCGASVKMDYGLEESGASTNSVKDALVSYFGYNESSMSLIKRSDYKQSVWNQMIYDEIKNSRPVFYSGKSTSGGHAFIIDGYDKEDYFHVNWGWGGDKDDYFLLNSLNNYNSGQSAIIGIESPNGLIEHKYAYATYKDNTLTFHYDNSREDSQEKVYYNIYNHINDKTLAYELDWLENTASITSVIFDSSFSEFKQLSSTEKWFWNMENLTSIQGLENINTKQVSSMYGMFYNCSNLKELNLKSFETQNATNMCSMFFNCKNLSSLDLSSLKTSNVNNMEKMFYGCESLTSLDLTSFDTRNVTNMSGMFEGCQKLSTVDVQSFNTGNVTDMGYMFYRCSSLNNLNLSSFDTRNVTDMTWMFSNCNSLTTLDVSNFYTPNVKHMSSMFSGCRSLKKLDLSSFTTINEPEMGHFFFYCENLETLNISNIDISEATNLSYMFYNCKKLKNIDLSGFDTRRVTDMTRMFSGCESLEMLNVENFETGKVKSMREMFALCKNLNMLDVSKFDTQNVTNMNCMFYNCKKLNNLELGNFNTQNVTDMNSMFSSCENFTILDLSNFDTQNVTDMSGMFDWCNNTKTIFVGDNWNTNNVTASVGMFSGCFRLVGQDGTKYNSNNAKDATMAHYDTGGYLTYKASSAIDTVNSDTNNILPRKFYSLDGKLLSAPHKGLNILRMSDSTTRKVIK